MPVIIKLKGMPWQTSSRDIKEFFRDSKIAEHDIHLAPNEDGKACGVGFACFYDDEDARRAMQRNGAYIGKRYVELFLSSQSEMDKALRDGVRMTTPNKPGGRFSRGGGTTEKRTSRKFSRDRSRSPRDRSSSKFDKESNGRSRSPVRSRGSSYTTARTGIDGRDSSDRVGSIRRGVGRGRGDRGRGSRGFRGRGRGGRGSYSNIRSLGDSSRDKDLRSKRDSSNDRSSLRPSQRSGGSAPRGDQGLFLKLTGMPFTAHDADVLLFLKGVKIAAVYIIPNKHGKHAGKSSGSAFVECASQEDCVKALKKHGQFLGSRYINVTRCTLEEIVSTLNIDMSLLSGQFPVNMSGGRGLEKQSNFGTASFSTNLSPGGPVGVDSSASMVAASANINLGDIKDGCVVGVRNLPVSTTPDDVLRLFQGFPAIPDSVRIHYIDANRCSGDAMITLVSNEHAKTAIRQISGKQMAGRKVEMFLL